MKRILIILLMGVYAIVAVNAQTDGSKRNKTKKSVPTTQTNSQKSTGKKSNQSKGKVSTQQSAKSSSGKTAKKQSSSNKSKEGNSEYPWEIKNVTGASNEKANSEGTSNLSEESTMLEDSYTDSGNDASSNKVYTSVEAMPVFPGGDAALLNFIATHMQYPAMAAEQGVEGRVVLQFVVTRYGYIGEIKIARSLSPDCDKEAIRVVKSMPSFAPGTQNGEPVNVWYTLPITFKLQK